MFIGCCYKLALSGLYRYRFLTETVKHVLPAAEYSLADALLYRERLGGANLLNKAGHEVLQGRAEGKLQAVAGNDVQYRRYADEPLNPRIINQILQGSTLIATIDRVPCTIQLMPTVADAYRAGALPLNTLANAVLAKSDQLRRIASQNYDDGQQETIVRTRGIQ